MNTGYFQLIFQAIIIFSIAFAGFRVKTGSSQRNNELKILEWFESMDTVSHKQRWRGERSQIVDVISINKLFTGIDVKMLCVTRSNRWFTLKAQSRWCDITKWQIEPIDIASVALNRGISEEDVMELAQSIKWEDAISDSASLKKKKSIQAKLSESIEK